MVVGVFDSTPAKESYMLNDVEGNLAGMVFNWFVKLMRQRQKGL